MKPSEIGIGSVVIGRKQPDWWRRVIAIDDGAVIYDAGVFTINGHEPVYFGVSFTGCSLAHLAQWSRRFATAEESAALPLAPSIPRLSYARAKDMILGMLEQIPHVRAPATEYLAALEDTKAVIDAWFEASIDAARDDVKRAQGDD